jgi:hypothetical protein
MQWVANTEEICKIKRANTLKVLARLIATLSYYLQVLLQRL